MPTTELKRRADTGDLVFQRLVEALITGQFASGEPLRESQLASQWEVSRTPMREAVRRAAEVGLLILRKNRAPLVRCFTAKDARCLYQLREVMEILALEQAWTSIPVATINSLQRKAKEATPDVSPSWIDRCLSFDEALHGAWFDHCQNPWLTQYLQQTRIYVRIFQHLMARDPSLVRRSYQEHCAILKTLGTSAHREGCKNLQRHIRNAGAEVMKLLEE